MIKKTIIVTFILLFCFFPFSYGQNYKTAEQVNKELEAFAKKNANKSKLHNLTKTYSGIDFYLLEIGTETKQKKKQKPGIFILANAEGTNPLSSLAALRLADKVIENKEFENYTWYIVPSLNPEASNHYFDKVKYENFRNSKPFNEDNDDATDEDDFEDLNGDGYITQMRVIHPQGTYVEDEDNPNILRKANTEKGEKGKYKLYSEGIDNDKDGEYNEDPKGGINNGINFPHLFETYKPTSGRWPGSEAEVYAVMKFIFEHPEIAVSFTLGDSDFCLQVPKSRRKGKADFSNIKLSERWANRLGVDKGKRFTMNELMEMFENQYSRKFTESQIASYLSLGAVVNPLAQDLVYYKELNTQYKKFLKDKNVNLKRLKPLPAKSGSFELWSYYHLGIPTFSINFFTVELPAKEKKDTLKTKKQEAKEDKKSDEKTKALIAYSKNTLSGKGFVEWEEFNHPDLGKVEIGGFIPYIKNTPPAEEADSLINLRLPWVFEICKKLPKLSISKTGIKSLGAGIYELDVWVTNENYLPFPTAMGERNQRVAPAIILLEGNELEVISGKQRTAIDAVHGNKTIKKHFLLKAKKGTDITIKLSSPNAGNDSKTVKLQ